MDWHRLLEHVVEEIQSDLRGRCFNREELMGVVQDVQWARAHQADFNGSMVRAVQYAYLQRMAGEAQPRKMTQLACLWYIIFRPDDGDAAAAERQAFGRLPPCC